MSHLFSYYCIRIFPCYKFLLNIFLFLSFNELFIGLLPCQGMPHFCSCNASKLWCHWPQTPLCCPQSCKSWCFGWFVRKGSHPGHQQDWSPPLLPVGCGRWQSQPPAWPWCSAGPHTPGPGYFNNSCLEDRRSEAKLKLWLVKEQYSGTLARMGDYLVILWFG